MKEPRWVSQRSLLNVQRVLIERYGGIQGLRDANLFESACMRARNCFAYGETDLAQLAAAYAFGLAKNHPFLDGNKRIAFMDAVLFLRKNGWLLLTSEADATEKTLALASGAISEQDYAAWVRAKLIEP